MESYTIAFIGAGPIGLYTAIQIKLLDPNKNIIMFEKYKIYQRNHTVRLIQTSFKHAVNNTEFKQILNNFGDKVPTSTIENELLEFARKIGIDIEYKKIESIDEIIDTYQNLEIIIDASGSHSIFRKLFQNDNSDVVLNNLNYLADVKYEVIGPTRPLESWTEIPKVTLQTNHLVTETVSKISDHNGCQMADNNTTQVSLHIFIDENQYNILKDFATFKNPIVDLNNRFIGTNLHNTIKTWLNARSELTNEQINPESFKLTVTNLPEYYATNVYTNIKGIDCYLVGDAAFGVPYFRSINNGFLSANVLSKVCTNSMLINSKLSNVVMNNKYYINYIYALQTKEKMVAHAKKLSINLTNSMVHSSQHSVQSMKSMKSISNNSVELIDDSSQLSSKCIIF